MIKYLNQPLVKNYVSLLLVQGGILYSLLVFPLWVGTSVSVSLATFYSAIWLPSIFPFLSITALTFRRSEESQKWKITTA